VRLPSPRSWAAALVLSSLAVVGYAPIAAAQIGTGGTIGTTGTLTPDDLLIVVQSKPGVSLPDFELQRFFNVANCQCDTPVTLFFTFTQAGFAIKPLLTDGVIEFWVGVNCNNPALRQCIRLGSQSLLTFAAASGTTVNTSARTLSVNFGQAAVSTGTTTTGSFDAGIGPDGGFDASVCSSGLQFSQSVWATVTLAGNVTGTPDVSTVLPVNIDLSPPPPPPVISVQPGNEGLIVNWTGIDAAATPDLLGYQVMCDRGGSLQVFADGTFGAGFQSCPISVPDPLDNGIHALNPLFVCSPLLSPLSTSFRVKILQNGIVYGATVVSIDQHLNAAVGGIVYQAPVSTTDFYQAYRNGDSANTMPGGMPDPGLASGGLCSVGRGVSRTTTTSLASGTGLAAVAALVLVARRRRRRR
jgi:hypothetical protein